MSATTTAVRETERKYAADEATELPDPAGLLGFATRGEPEDQHLAAIYFDTDDLRLLRAQVTLRRREGGHDEGWHLKLPRGEDSRQEIRLPLSSAGRRRPPTRLTQLTSVYTRGMALKPVAELVTHRRRWVLVDGAGHELVEVVDDHVTAHTMGRQTTASSWREIEVELAEQGQPELLDTVEQRLGEVGIRRLGSGSKLGRVLGPRLRADPRVTTKKIKSGTAAEVVLDYLGDRLAEIRAQDPLVRQDAPDALHQMRVAARRARSALQAFRTVLSRDETRELIEELKWLGNELSEARDSEVIEDRLVEVTHGLPDELVFGPVTSQITRSVQRRRADGQHQALEALNSDRYLGLQRSFEHLLAHPPLTGRARRKAGPVMATTIDRAWRRLKKRKRAADAAAPGPELDSALHETRKMAKRLRYTAEVAERVGGKGHQGAAAGEGGTQGARRAPGRGRGTPANSGAGRRHA